MFETPIDEVTPEILAALSGGSRLVIAAPPGAGKTTRVPMALLDEPWLAGKRILLLEPRRIAARMAAERMAASVNEKAGGLIGLSTRIDRKVSGRTRIEVITDGLFTRRILSDPELHDVGAVLFDEFHERSLSLDAGLALALDAQSGLRPDLRIVLMSATLDTAMIAGAIEAPVVESDGRMHPVETIYAGRSDDPLPVHTARIVRRALREQTGSILVFLPGMGEILRTAEILADLPRDVVVAPLYGALSPAEQDRAVAPPPQGVRKVVLSTDIAESSLTIEGVDTVIDAGLARVAEIDAAGVSSLVTRRASRASVDQRRGRAGRTGPGVCYRLWDEAATRGLPAQPVPEILSSNLSGLMLTLLEWGERDPSRLTWIDAPPAGRISAAVDELRRCGAIDDAGGLTARGRKMSSLPVEPRLAAMIASAESDNDRALAAEIAILISERGLGGVSADIRERIARFRTENSPRAKALRDQAARWANGARPAGGSEAGRIIAGAVAGSIARSKGGSGQYLLESGRAAQLDPSSPLSKEKWLAVADITGSATNARIVAAAPLSEEVALACGRTATEEIAEFDVQRKAFRARRVKRLGAIILSETPLPAPSGPAARRALVAALRLHGIEVLGAARAIRELQARIGLAKAHSGDEWPTLTDSVLIDRADEWLEPLLGDPPDLERPGPDQVKRSVLALFDWTLARKLDEAAPQTIETPAGRILPIDYLRDGGPVVEARAQEFYGLRTHPTIVGGRVPLTVSLLSPARRQIALTRDLPSFWRGGYRDMAKEMRGQYPKHDWPDDPANAKAHAGKTKAALMRDS